MGLTQASQVSNPDMVAACLAVQSAMLRAQAERSRYSEDSSPEQFERAALAERKLKEARRVRARVGGWSR
jgi:hypothetical protein